MISEHRLEKGGFLNAGISRRGRNVMHGWTRRTLQGGLLLALAAFAPAAQAQTPPFVVNCIPSDLTVKQGGSVSTTCRVGSTGLFSGLVELDCRELRTGESCAFHPNPVDVPPDDSVTTNLELTLPPSTTPNDYRFYVRARSGAIERFREMQLHVVTGAVPCEDGRAGEFLCQDVDLAAYFPPSSIGAVAGSTMSVSGWSDTETGREYAIVGHTKGTAFLDVTDPDDVTYLGSLHPHGDDSSRHVTVFNHHLYVVSSSAAVGEGDGMQIFDLRRLRDVSRPPTTFGESAHYAGFTRALDISVNAESGFAYAAGTDAFAVGDDRCPHGVQILSLQDPLRPAPVGCFGDQKFGNVAQEAQCVVYRGPDLAYRGREICFVLNEDSISIGDVQDKGAERFIARTTEHPEPTWVRHGRLTEDHRYFLQADEVDEQFGNHNTRTYIWDMADLDAPKLIGHYDGPTEAVDRQVLVKGNEAYQANYRAGFRLLSLSRIGGGELDELAYFDTRPESDSRAPGGAFASHPFHKNGLVTVVDDSLGLFVLRPTACLSPATPVLRLPVDGAPNQPSSPALDWDDVADASSYDVELATDSTFENVVLSKSGLASSGWIVTPGLNGSVTYWWRARAVSGCGSGAWSAGSSFTTDPNRPPVLAPISDRLVQEDQLLTFTLTATDPDGDPVSFAAAGLPAGATFDHVTGTFAWRPSFTQAGHYPGVFFAVGDGRGGTDDETIAIAVIDVNRPPVASAGTDQTVPVGTGVTLDGTGSSDPDGDPLTYRWTQHRGLPVTIQGANTDRATVDLVAPGSYVFELQVSDGSIFNDVSRDEVTVTVTGATAVYDPVLRAPKCSLHSDSCDSGELLVGRDGKGPEPNQPNTIRGTCADGTSGAFHVDESVDRVRVATLDGRAFAPGKTVRIEATVWAWTRNPAADRLDLYYAADASQPAWTLVATLTPTAGGSQTLSATYTLPVGQWQAVRARFRYNGTQAPCQSGPFDDHDDLVFAVDQTAAAFDPVLKAPKCAAVSGVCDSGTLLVGRDGVGPEPNQPNTINGSCADGTAGVFHVDHSNDRIRVSTLDGSPFAPGKIVKVETTVWTSARTSPRLNLYYAADANNPNWVPVKILWASHPSGAQTLSTVYRLPEGNVQAVRAGLYEGGYGACLPGDYNDHDDLVFAVGNASPPVVARFDPALKAPLCDAVGRSCDSGTLLVGRDGKGPEPNQPNTIEGTCADGTSGTFHVDESVDAIRVSTLDGGVFAPGKTVKVEATVWAWKNPAADHLDLYHAADAAQPIWIHIATLTPAAPDAQVLSASYTLPVGKRQAVRARFRYQGSPAACRSGPYDDHDDLVFAVDHTTAAFDADLKVPTCAGNAGACDSGTLLVGRAGGEPNQPNTLYGSCPDGTIGHRLAVDAIRVSALDGGGFAPGKTVKLEAVVRPILELATVVGTLELYGAPDARSPEWTRIASLGAPNDGVAEAELLTATYVLPPGELQAVRARFRRTFGDPQGVPCTGQFTGHWNDHDDLVFAVRPEPRP